MLSRALVLPEGCYTLNRFANVGNALTVSAGSTITFGGAAQLSIETNGSLEAVGTAEKPIVLRGKDGAAGSWGGLVISSRSSHNRLSYVTVEDAGVTGSDNAAILLAPGSQLAIDHSTVKRSLGSGIFVMDDAAFSHFEENHFANTDIPLRVKASDLAKIDSASTFTENTNNVVVIPFGEGKLDENVLWHKLAVPYRFEANAEVGAKLTIEAGAQFQFRDSIRLYVNSKGSLTAIGTETAPILFTGTDETADYWKGVAFDSNSSSNVLRHVEVRFGGSKNPTEGGGVTINHQASATVQSSAISSCTVGIYVGSEGTLNGDAAASNRFQNVGQKVFIEK
jgi:nitrous oxidase accessory protein NosD